MNIGVFDSGRGGEIIADYFRSEFPDDALLLVTDTENLPYGSRRQQEIINLTDTAIQPLLQQCDVVVLACNTATAAAIDTLRARYPFVKFVGVEPMVKPAALASKTGTIAVFATPATLASERYQKLKKLYAKNLTLLEPDCADWAVMIEQERVDEALVTAAVRETVRQGADVILLSCTHYIAIKPLIAEAAGTGVRVLEPSSALSARIRQLTAIEPL